MGIVKWCGAVILMRTVCYGELLYGSKWIDYRTYVGLGRLINDGSYTRIDISQGKYSMLDLTIVSKNLAVRCDWKVMSDSTLGSDHFPIYSKIIV